MKLQKCAMTLICLNDIMHAKWKRTNKNKDHMLYNSINMKCPQEENFRDRGPLYVLLPPLATKNQFFVSFATDLC